MKNLLLLIMLNFTAFANAQTGTISGTVTTEDEEIVMFATVAVKMNDSLITRTQTDFDGKYQFDSLRVGMYNVVVIYVGYQTKTISNVIIFSNEIGILNIELNKGTTTYCPVFYTLPLMELDNTTQGAVFTAEEIQRNPIRN